jgi:hypothetical protein
MSNLASPPLTPTVQMSPPDTKAISDLSGDNEGSVKYALASTGRLCCATVDPASIRITDIRKIKRRHFLVRFIISISPDQRL